MDSAIQKALPTNHASFMRRAIMLAQLGLGQTQTNPLVGCVIVYKNKIIGEGYHKKFGEAHAEVNAINSVLDENKSLLKDATLYVTLEPCCHTGKTPPCTNLIIKHKISQVFIATLDPYDAVKGKGVEVLKQHGVEVTIGLLEYEASIMNRRFLCNQQLKRPYIILKWAQSADGFMQSNDPFPTKVSGKVSQLILHKWRSQEDAFIIGKQTLCIDNPTLNNRLYTGKQPLRIIFANAQKSFENLNLFNFESEIWVIGNNHQVDALPNTLLINQDTHDLNKTMKTLFAKGVSSVVVEGGKLLIDSFIRSELYDEFRVFKSKTLKINNGLEAPLVPAKYFRFAQTHDLETDYYIENIV